MSYLVLARKYRPRDFADLVGQEVTANTLRGAISEGRVGHAYLFCGPRGTGKTTSARIFAKALNCEKGPTVDPCGECERCRAADSGAEADLIEMDAASNRGIDAIRDLLSQVAYAPMRARFKVYILDEAHMLTKEASNALLKTLEEPPAHVKFFLATTEPDKILPTIRSRCQMVQLAPLSEKQIADRLTWVFEREGIAADPRVAPELARRARGGLRDALSSADQLLSLSGTAPTFADVERLSGAGGANELEALCDALEAAAPEKALALLPATRGGETELCSALLEHVRATLVTGLCGADNPFVEADAALRAKLVERARRLGAERLQAWMEELLGARERMRYVPAHARVVLESALLVLARPAATASLAELVDRLASLEERLAGAPGAMQATSGASTPTRSAPSVPSNGSAGSSSSTSFASSATSPHARAGAPTIERAAPSMTDRSAATMDRSAAAMDRSAPARSAPLEIADAWKATLAELGRTSQALAELLAQRGKLAAIDDRTAEIRLNGVRESERALLSEPRNKKACAQALARVVGREVELRWGDAEPPQRAPRDPFTSQVSELFGGRIEDDA